jgi:NADH-quinone oxidoreductase subunit J
MSVPAALFYAFGFVAVAGAIGAIANPRNIVAAVMSLAMTTVSLAGIYVLLGAHLIAVFQIMVYGGAIVVLFLFSVMLLNLPDQELPPGRHRLVKFSGAVVAAAALTGLLRAFSGFPEVPPVPKGFGGTRAVGIALFTDYVLLVETVSLVLLAAIVGGMILAKRKQE